MTNKKFFTSLGGVGLLAVIIFSISSSHQLASESSPIERSRLNQASAGDTENNESVRMNQAIPEAAPELRQQMDSFELIENKYAKLNMAEAQQEVRRIDHEAQKDALKNFNDFSVAERAAFLNHQRVKAVLVNKIILARFERIQK